MESLNRILENALSFICLVQKACDQKRFLLEETYNQEFNSFLKQWKHIQKEKQIQEKVTQQLMQKKNINNGKGDEKDVESEELALADALLQKARLIRQKFKLSSNVVVQDYASCSTQVITGVQSKLAETENPQQQLKSKTTNKKIIHSKSTTAIHHCKMKSVIPHSKSDNLPNNNLKNCTSHAIESHSIKEGQKQTSVISKKELSTFRKTVVPKKRNNGVMCKGSTVDHPMNLLTKDVQDNLPSVIDLPCKKIPVQESHTEDVQPTHIHFLKTLQGMEMSRTKSRASFYSSKIWYPFISFKNENHMFHRIKLKSTDELSKICVLLHNIQEAMLWLDIFSLMSAELIPVLMGFDENNIDHLLICSYLRSIFHNHQQRTPVLAPD